MKKILKIFFSGIIAFIMVLSACEKVQFKPPDIPVPDSISYSADIQPIWDDNCVICHKGQRNPDLRPDGSYLALTGGGYINTADPPASSLITKLYGSHNSRATLSEKVLIEAWISLGAKDN